MELIFHELKKIWRPVLLVAILMLGMLYFFLFPSYYIEYFSDGSDVGASFELSANWAEKYGTTLEAEERAELDGQLTQEKALFSERLKAFDESAQYGVFDWESFMTFNDNYYDEVKENDSRADMVIESAIWKIIGGTNFYTIQSLMNLMQTYDDLALNIPPNLNYSGYGDSAAVQEKKLARIDEIKNSPTVHGYLPSVVLSSTDSYVKYYAVWSILSVILLLAPTLVRDRLHKTRCMQWSSRKGRRILNTQIITAMLSAAVLSLINFIAYAVPFIMQHPLIFKDFKLFSFQLFRIPWFDWTYGQYLLVVAVMIFVLTMAAGGFTAVLSQYSTNYVAMLLKVLPLFAVMAFVCYSWIVGQAFFTGNKLSDLSALPGAEFIVTGVIAALSIVLCTVACYRQRHRELYSA